MVEAVPVKIHVEIPPPDPRDKARREELAALERNVSKVMAKQEGAKNVAEPEKQLELLRFAEDRLRQELGAFQKQREITEAQGQRSPEIDSAISAIEGILDRWFAEQTRIWNELERAKEQTI